MLVVLWQMFNNFEATKVGRLKISIKQTGKATQIESSETWCKQPKWAYHQLCQSIGGKYHMAPFAASSLPIKIPKMPCQLTGLRGKMTRESSHLFWMFETAILYLKQRKQAQARRPSSDNTNRIIYNNVNVLCSFRLSRFHWVLKNEFMATKQKLEIFT